jgi:hypothetical protein
VLISLSRSCASPFGHNDLQDRGIIEITDLANNFRVQALQLRLFVESMMRINARLTTPMDLTMFVESVDQLQQNLPTITLREAQNGTAFGILQALLPAAQQEYVPRKSQLHTTVWDRTAVRFCESYVGSNPETVFVEACKQTLDQVGAFLGKLKDPQSLTLQETALMVPATTNWEEEAEAIDNEYLGGYVGLITTIH